MCVCARAPFSATTEASKSKQGTQKHLYMCSIESAVAAATMPLSLPRSPLCAFVAALTTPTVSRRRCTAPRPAAPRAHTIRCSATCHTSPRPQLRTPTQQPQQHMAVATTRSSSCSRSSSSSSSGDMEVRHRLHTRQLQRHVVVALVHAATTTTTATAAAAAGAAVRGDGIHRCIARQAANSRVSSSSSTARLQRQQLRSPPPAAVAGALFCSSAS